MSSDRPDYSVLLDSNLDYQELKKAKATGYSDKEVATISQIARLTGVPFRDIYEAVLRGVTFFQLADRYNLSLSDIHEISDEQTRIAAFESAYEATGSGFRRVASAQNTELEAMYSRFREMNANFPPTATPITLTFQPRPSEMTTTVETTTETTTVRAAPVEAPVETVKTVQPAVKPVHRVVRVTHAKRVRAVRHRTVRVQRRHQVHHHLPVYMRRGS